MNTYSEVIQSPPEYTKVESTSYSAEAELLELVQQKKEQHLCFLTQKKIIAEKEHKQRMKELDEEIKTAELEFNAKIKDSIRGLKSETHQTKWFFGWFS